MPPRTDEVNMSVAQKLATCALLLLTPVVRTAYSYSDQLHGYLLANYHQFRNDMLASDAWYRIILATPPEIHTIRGYIHLLFQTKQFHKIILLAPAVDAAIAQDKDLHKIIAHSYSAQGNHQEATKRLFALYEYAKDDPEIVLAIVQHHMNHNDLSSALSTIQTHIDGTVRRTHTFLFHLVKARIYLQLHDFSEALIAVKSCLETHPHFDKAWLLFGLINQELGNVAEAIRGYRSYVQSTPHPQPAIMKLLATLIDQQKVDSPPHTQPQSVDVALKLFHAGNYYPALRTINQAIATNKSNSEAHILKITIARKLGNDTLLWHALHNAVIALPDNQLWYEIAYTLALEGTNVHHKAFFARHVDMHAWARLYKAHIELHNREWERAYQTLSPLCDEQTEQTHVTPQVLYSYATICYMLGNYKAALHTAHRILQTEPDHSATNNLIAYYYATQEKNLENALYHCHISLKKEPGNLDSLDTYATILYKQKEYLSAKEIFQDLCKKDVHNASYLFGLAKVLCKLNYDDKDECYNCLAKGVSCMKYPHEAKIAEKIKKNLDTMATNP
jgi:tetratricopeptide (TPR) repeat protein